MFVKNKICFGTRRFFHTQQTYFGKLLKNFTFGKMFAQDERENLSFIVNLAMFSFFSARNFLHPFYFFKNRLSSSSQNQPPLEPNPDCATDTIHRRHGIVAILIIAVHSSLASLKRSFLN